MAQANTREAAPSPPPAQPFTDAAHPPARAIPPAAQAMPATLVILRGAIGAMITPGSRDYSPRQLVVLLQLYAQPVDHTTGGLAASVTLPDQAVARALDSLLETGLAVRRVDEADRRRAFFRISTKGCMLVHRLHKGGLAAYDRSRLDCVEPAGAAA